jgi:hypothetical protein
MDKKTTGILLTIVTLVACGCPGLVGLCLGALAALASTIPGAEIDMFGSNEPRAALTWGLGVLCLSILLIAIPVVVGIVTLRSQPAPGTVLPPDEPLPPPS